MGKKVAGTCYVKVDGAQFEVQGGVEAPLSDKKRESVMGSGGVAGYKETDIAPYVKLTAVITADFPLDKIKAGTDMTITTEFANGKVYTLSGAWFAGESSLKGEDGTSEIEFGGMRGQWK